MLIVLLASAMTVAMLTATAVGLYEEAQRIHQHGFTDWEHPFQVARARHAALGVAAAGEPGCEPSRQNGLGGRHAAAFTSRFYRARALSI